MTSRKKVSFGSSGSIVETWIIDDVRSNQFSPDTDVRKFGSSEFCDDVMPTSRDIVVVTQPVNCNRNNHVVLNDPISIFRKDNMDGSSTKVATESETELERHDNVITTQPSDRAVLKVTTKTVNFSSPSEIISGDIQTDNNNTIAPETNYKSRVDISPHRDAMTENKNSNENSNNNKNNNNSSNNNNNNNSAVISTSQRFHRGKRSSIGSNASSSGSQSFRQSRTLLHTPGQDTDDLEEYYNVLNPQPVGQT